MAISTLWPFTCSFFIVFNYYIMHLYSMGAVQDVAHLRGFWEEFRFSPPNLSLRVESFSVFWNCLLKILASSGGALKSNRALILRFLPEGSHRPTTF